MPHVAEEKKTIAKGLKLLWFAIKGGRNDPGAGGQSMN